MLERSLGSGWAGVREDGHRAGGRVEARVQGWRGQATALPSGGGRRIVLRTGESSTGVLRRQWGRGAENDLEGALESEENPGPPPGSGIQERQDPRAGCRAAVPEERGRRE